MLWRYEKNNFIDRTILRQDWLEMSVFIYHHFRLEIDASKTNLKLIQKWTFVVQINYKSRLEK